MRETRETERETRDTERQTDRQREMETDRQREIKTERHTGEIEIESETYCNVKTLFI